MSVSRRPHQDTFFLLVPTNKKARDVVQDQDNSHLVSLSPENLACFDIGFHIDSQTSPGTLANFGRNNCDITLRPTSISRLHCSFEVDLDTGVVMFHDFSPSHKTMVSGDPGRNFKKGRLPRKILVHSGFNEKISMGGTNRNLIEFELQWIAKEEKIKRIIKIHIQNQKVKITNPRKARTHDTTETVLHSTLMTPDQAFQESSQTGPRYLKRELLGSGSFGSVWRVIDIDSGQLMAMKQIDCLPQQQQQAQFRNARREVELMRRSNHVRSISLRTPYGVAYAAVAEHCKLNHVAGLGKRVFVYPDIHGSRE